MVVCMDIGVNLSKGSWRKKIFFFWILAQLGVAFFFNGIPVKSDYSGDWEELMETITIFLNIVMNFYHFAVVILFCFSCSTIVVLPNLWWIIVQPQGNSLRFMMRCWCSLSGSIIHVYAGWVHCILWKEKEPQGG